MATTAIVEEKKKSKLRHIPNIISLSRIPFSIALPFLAGMPVPFLCCFGIAGVNDVLDGWIARRFHWESQMGAKFDSVGDVVFLICAIGTALWKLEKLHFELYIYIAMAVIIAIRLVNLVFTRFKFKEWGYIHNNSVRWSTIPIFFLMPVCVLTKKVPNPFLLGCLCLIVLASLEETWILRNMVEYDMSMKSIYHMKKLLKAPVPALEEARETTTV